MSFDAAPREKLVPSRPKRAAPEPEKPARKPGHLSGLQIVGILVGIGVLAYIKTEFFPSESDRKRQAEIDQIQRDNREAHEARMRELHRSRLTLLSAMGPPCATLAEELGRAWVCDRAENQITLARRIDSVVITDANACARELSELAALRQRLGCR